jgi:hypothetical protein
MKGAVAILFGLLGLWVGITEIRKALKTGTFYGWGGARYRAEPGSAMYRLSMVFRAGFILLAVAVLWVGVETISH